MAQYKSALSRLRALGGDEYDGRVRWFGKSWGAPVCDPAYWTETPIGEICLECGAGVVDGDQGLICACDPSIEEAFWWWYGGDEHSVCAYHVDCFQHTVIGGREERRS